MSRNPVLSLIPATPTPARPPCRHTTANGYLRLAAVVVAVLATFCSALLVVASARHSTPATSSAADTRIAAAAATPTSPDPTGLEYHRAHRALSSRQARHLAYTAAPWLVDLTTRRADGHTLAGTGIVIRSNGLVITNAHVILTAQQVTATTYGGAGDTYHASIIRLDRRHDLALVQLRHAHRLATAPLADSDTIRANDPAATLGNAWGRGETWIGTGRVTRLHTSIPSTTGTGRRLTNLIEVHTNLSPGQSGGPLIDSQGRVTGLNVAYLHRPHSTQPTGTGYVIPINTALRLITHHHTLATT